MLRQQAQEREQVPQVGRNLVLVLVLLAVVPEQALELLQVQGPRVRVQREQVPQVRAHQGQEWTCALRVPPAQTLGH